MKFYWDDTCHSLYLKTKCISLLKLVMYDIIPEV